MEKTQIRSTVMVLFDMDDTKYDTVLEAIATREGYLEQVKVKDGTSHTTQPNPVTKDELLLQFLKNHLVVNTKQGIIMKAEKEASKQASQLAQGFTI